MRTSAGQREIGGCMKPRNYVARTQQSGAGKHSGHAARKKAEAKRATLHEVAATAHNELHSAFFGVPNVPLREIRERIDPILKMHEIREITKIYIGEEDDDA
jgi:hypothetical protein